MSKFIARGDPLPKLDDFEWFTRSESEFVDSETWVCDDVIKVCVSLSSRAYCYDRIEVDAVVTLIGMHRDYRTPGIAMMITVSCWSYGI